MELSNEVLSVYNEFKKCYGAIKNHIELNDRNIPGSVKRVRHHFEKCEIKNIVVKKYQYQKNQGSDPDNKENFLNCNFGDDTVYKKLVTDIIYIHVVNAERTFLASVMELYNQKIIGWAYGKNMIAERATILNSCFLGMIYV